MIGLRHFDDLKIETVVTKFVSTDLPTFLTLTFLLYFEEYSLKKTPFMHIVKQNITLKNYNINYPIPF